MRTLLGVAALLCLTALPSQAADEKKADKTDKDKLAGTWVLTSIQVMSKTIEVPEGMAMSLIFKGDKVTKVEKNKKDEDGTYKMDEAKKPKEIDIITPKETNPKEMETMKGIYTLDGDTFKLGFADMPQQPRPKNFDDKNIGIMIFKRKK